MTYVRSWLLGMAVLAACGGGDEAVPTAAELYGDWTSMTDGATKTFHFAASDDGTHGELAGMTDVYSIATGPDPADVVQDGHYLVERREVTGYGTTDALVTIPASGSSAGMMFGNAILGYDTDSLTISSTTTASGKLVLVRQ